MPSALRWGIASAGKISHDFCVGLSTLPFDEHQISAVAARDITRAQSFAKVHEIPKALGSYAELAEANDVGKCFAYKVILMIKEVTNSQILWNCTLLQEIRTTIDCYFNKLTIDCQVYYEY